MLQYAVVKLALELTEWLKFKVLIIKVYKYKISLIWSTKEE